MSSEPSETPDVMSEDSSKENMSSQTIEKLEEAKLRAKFPMGPNHPMAGNRPLSGHSTFLQRRLQKGQKFFDSGDYQMAKQQVGSVKPAPPPQLLKTGEEIPKPETVPVRKTSIIQPTKFTSTSS